MRWDEFEAAAPELAALGREAFEEEHMSTIGTLRANGWPRISPTEIYFVDGELMLSLMPNARKSQDLRRDNRITLANGQVKRIPVRGDFKLYGHALEILDRRRRDLLADYQEKVIDWRPPDTVDMFSVDILSAAYISFGESRRAMRWSVDDGLQRLRHPDD